MSRFSRREFLEQSLFAAAALPVAASAQESAKPKSGANERLRVGVTGVRGQGRVHVSKFSALADVEVVAICDPDTNVIGDAMSVVEKKTGKKATHYADLRKLLEDKSIDAISVAAPNHWHCLAGIWAVQAGKHVYVEKPLSHNLWEGRKLVEAARKYDRRVQMGNYPRSLGHVRAGIEFLHSGKLGKVKVARGICYNKRDSIGKQPAGTPPPGVDYNLWLGPAPEKPFTKNRFHYNWHWNWDFGGGEIGNNGIYQLDTARWGIARSDHPAKIVSVGGRFGYEDDGQTPNTQAVVYDYGDVQIVQEVRGLPTEKYRGDMSMGNIFECEQGLMVFSIQGTAAFTPKGELIQRFAGAGDHYRNFVDAIKSGKSGDLTSEVLDGHLSTALVHLGNISHRLGTPKSAKQADPFVGNEPGQETWGRFTAHLKDNGVDLESVAVTLGKVLAFDSKTERFGADADANALLSREYRKPFVVPENV